MIIQSFLESGAVRRLVQKELNRNNDTGWVVALSRDGTALRSSTSFHHLILRKVIMNLVRRHRADSFPIA